MFVLFLLFVSGSFSVPCDGYAIRPPLKVAAFNVRVFGQTKMEKAEVMDTLVKIFLRYDISLVQEIRDAEHKVIETLVQMLNVADNGTDFTNITSIRLGRSDSKEQYSFIYRRSLVNEFSSYQSMDYDKFERPPFAVRFHASNAELQDFAIMALHSKPDHAKEEIEALFEEYTDLKQIWNLQNILLAGDFNADCSYLSKGTGSLNISIPDEYDWLISDYEDTTVTSTDCSYDRFVALGPELRKAVVPQSAKEFQFDEAYGFTRKQAEGISDHYPIEVGLKGKVDEDEIGLYQPQMTVAMKDPRTHAASNVQAIARTQKYKGNGFVVTYEYLGGTKTHVIATKDGIAFDDVIGVVKEFRQLSENNLFRPSIVDVVREFLASEILSGQHYVYGFNLNTLNSYYDVKFRCDYKEPYACEVQLSKSLINETKNTKRDFLKGKLAKLLNDMIRE